MEKISDEERDVLITIYINKINPEKGDNVFYTIEEAEAIVDEHISLVKPTIYNFI